MIFFFIWYFLKKILRWTSSPQIAHFKCLKTLETPCIWKLKYLQGHHSIWKCMLCIRNQKWFVFFHPILLHPFITGGLQNRYRDTPRGLPDSRRWSLRRRSCEVGGHEAGDHLEGKLKVPWNLKKMWNEFLLPKLFWHTVRKNYFSDR